MAHYRPWMLQRHVTGMRWHARRLLSAKQRIKIAFETTIKSLIIQWDSEQAPLTVRHFNTQRDK
jgi:hypothetical protein